MKIGLICCILTGLLTGCAAALTMDQQIAAPKPPKFPDSAYAPLPSNYRSICKAWVKAQLFDPYSAHIDFVGTHPMKWGYRDASGQWRPCYTVLMLVNAKNRFGAYVGDKEFSVDLVGSKIVHTFAEPAI